MITKIEISALLFAIFATFTSFADLSENILGKTKRNVGICVIAGLIDYCPINTFETT